MTKMYKKPVVDVAEFETSNALLISSTILNNDPIEGFDVEHGGPVVGD